MSVTVESQSPKAMLEEFERRLRLSHATNQRKGAPLAELARLVVGHEDPFKIIFEPNDQRSAETRANAEDPAGHEHPHARERILNGDFTTTEVGSPGANDEPKYRRNGDETTSSHHAGISDKVFRLRRPLHVFAAIVIGVGLAGLTASLISWTEAPRPSGMAITKAETELAKLQAETATGADVLTKDASIVGPSTQSLSVAPGNNTEQLVDAARAQEHAPSAVSLHADSWPRNRGGWRSEASSAGARADCANRCSYSVRAGENMDCDDPAGWHANPQ